jgi:hypothetical protein
MKELFFATGKLILAIIFLCFAIQAVIAPAKDVTVTECPKYYDGEGNEIPQRAVELLVMSEYVRLLPKEIDTLQKHFYFMTRHICPYSFCTMRDQVRFHGCGWCNPGSICYDLDGLHWDYPTAPYDDHKKIYRGWKRDPTIVRNQRGSLGN